MSVFNSKEYEWSGVKLFMLARFVTGLQGVSYTSKQEKEYVYGTGGEPRAIQHGNRSYEGELKLLQSELEALILASPKKEILDLDFDIVVSYSPRGGLQIITDTLKGCELSEVPKGMEQNDKMMEITLPIIFLRLKHQS